MIGPVSAKAYTLKGSIVAKSSERSKSQGLLLLLWRTSNSQFTNESIRSSSLPLGLRGATVRVEKRLGGPLAMRYQGSFLLCEVSEASVEHPRSPLHRQAQTNLHFSTPRVKGTCLPCLDIRNRARSTT